MKPYGERLVALILLAVCVLYGMSASTIDVFPGREHELITSRTLPHGLAAIGTLCSLWILFSAPAAEPRAGTQRLAWSRCAALILAAAVYSFAIARLGFIISTAGFLAAGSLLMGERRVWLVATAALLLPVSFWLVLEVGLGIRLPSLSLLAA